MDEPTISPAAVARGLIKVDPDYVKKPTGIIKLVEFVLLLLAWALCSGFRSGFINVMITGYSTSSINYSESGVGFFLFVTVTLWIVVIIYFILGLLSLLDKLKIPMKMLILSLFHGISAVLLLIATAIIAADAADFPSKFCDYIRKSPYYSTTCATYEAAVAFGVFSCLAFVIDAVLHFFNYRQDGGAATV